MKIYLVGGAVRDALLNLPVKERDWVVVGATPEGLLSQGYTTVGKDFPVFLHPETKEEYALARTERKCGKGYKGFEVNASSDVTLEEDLKRRDLTINAMAQTLEGTLVDPYGGQTDLRNKVLRHVSSAFVEDPLRVLRVARFMARLAPLGFTVAPETMQLMQTIVSHDEMEALTPERVWKEFEKSLASDSPVAFLRVLRESGALKRILPEVDRLYGIPQPKMWHPEVDTGIHVELALEMATQLTANPQIRFAVLMHDVGKGMTPEALWPQHVGHEDLGVELIEAALMRLKIPNAYSELAILVSKYHTYTHRADKLNPSTLLNVLERLDAFRRGERFEQFLIACIADALGRAGLSEEPYPQADILRRALIAAKRVDIKMLTSTKRYEGEALKEAIRQVRVAAIHAFLKR
ncbi:MAG: multifunctional CCA addition/repair protein [Gammaproteobacteria bacterium]